MPLALVSEYLIGPFKIENPTIALFFEDGWHVAHTLLAGSIVTAMDCRVGEKGLIDAIWDGKRVLMFAMDLKSVARR